MLPDYYEFQNSTKILSGELALENIPFELTSRNAQKPFVISDAILEKIGTVQTVLDAIDVESIEIGDVYTQVPQDSDLALINQLASKYRNTNCDSIVAVGGGSVIDTAKGLKMVLSQEVEDINMLMGAENIK